MSDLALGAVVAFDFEKWDVREELRILDRLGARRCQVYRNILQGIAPEDIRGALDPAGIACDSLHAYIDLPDILGGPSFDVSSPDPDRRAAAMDLFRDEADYARALGARDVIVHPVGPGKTRDDPGRERALAASAAEMARIARDAGVRALLENMPPPMFGADARVLRRVVDDVASDHLGLAYDSGHAMIADDPVGTVRTMGDRLWGVHLHDNDGTEDGHFLPGLGVLPFEAIAAALAEVGFAGTFMLEIYRDTDDTLRALDEERLAFIEHLRRTASGLPAPAPE